MACLRGARYALAPRWHQPLGYSVNPLHTSLRPCLAGSAQRFTQPRLSSRNFHISAFADGCVQSVQNALLHMHIEGIPWHLAIPMLAVSVALVRFPLQAYSGKVIERQSEAAPVINSWRYVVSLGKLQKALRLARERKRILAERKAQDWKTWTPMLGVPFWLVNSEAIRRLCGANGGIFSLLTGNYKETTVSDQTAASSSAVDAVANGVQSVGPSLDLGVYNDAGQLLLDLAAPDPYFILPATLCFTMAYTFWPRTPEMRKLVFDLADSNTAFLPTSTKWRVRLSRATLLMSFAIPVICIQLPSGLFLYWITSMWATQGLNKLTTPEKKIKENAIRPCRKHEEWILRRTV
ncbi:Mitochondrial inner membrane protein oxa1-1 [Colletotrichum truncatum]|uniref:Mitochondrial inner membrane protein oxa1-1 n=1 Tax=Colletotrichum truncatum TaxID=5467 RepID=A0ACC3Z9X9_COLTU|nr:Mitochondrial inner membrane protein oxa1-1 [Colletotrichum truncatum]KAF6796047.1 Mitochondrial inner membrane protein oxa1-1 [Colletotrichum truncatum]